MEISITDRLVRRLELLGDDLKPERLALSDLPIESVPVSAGYSIVREGDHPTRSCLVLDGFVAATKFTGEGERQITSLYVAGDIPDLQSLHLEMMDINFITLTGATLGFIGHTSLLHLCDRYPRISHALWRNTLVDAAIYREWITNVGQRPAKARMAHLMCEMVTRQRNVGLSNDLICAFPLTQADLASALGLSLVHVSRTLQQLRHEKLIELRNRQLAVLDWDRLTEAGDFLPDYLHRRPG